MNNISFAWQHTALKYQQKCQVSPREKCTHLCPCPVVACNALPVTSTKQLQVPCSYLPTGREDKNKAMGQERHSTSDKCNLWWSHRKWHQGTLLGPEHPTWLSGYTPTPRSCNWELRPTLLSLILEKLGQNYWLASGFSYSDLTNCRRVTSSPKSPGLPQQQPSASCECRGLNHPDFQPKDEKTVELQHRIETQAQAEIGLTLSFLGSTSRRQKYSWITVKHTDRGYKQLELTGKFFQEQGS